ASFSRVDVQQPGGPAWPDESQFLQGYGRRTGGRARARQAEGNLRDMVEPTMNQAVYDVLSPWSETDPIPLQGISPRPADIRGKRIGLFTNNKPAAGPIQDVVEAELRTRYGGEV